jgi:hypothetical protein
MLCRLCQSRAATDSVGLFKDQARLEVEMEAARKQLKHLTGLLAEKGATPEDVGPGMLQAMLSLTDKRKCYV